MANSKNIVVTTYGHGKNIDKISVSLFDCPDGADESNAVAADVKRRYGIHGPGTNKRRKGSAGKNIINPQKIYR
jgi:hypothetical protein